MSKAQSTFPLYENIIPNSIDSKDEEKTEDHGIVSAITRPTITVFVPQQKSSNAAVIIFPGGGYWVNAIQHEGFDVAKKFNDAGIVAFVVKYRIPNAKTMKNPTTGPLQDAQQAIAWVRRKAEDWGIDAKAIGIMGFSAGGHLASTAGTHFRTAVDPLLQKQNLRPDFMLLIYPVISFQNNIGHLGSREQLIGKSPAKADIDLYSNEMQVTQDTPPTFLVHASDDDEVVPQNSIAFYEALKKNNVPSELHIYERGGHGFGMINPTTSELWMDRCIAWMRLRGWAK